MGLSLMHEAAILHRMGHLICGQSLSQEYLPWGLYQRIASASEGVHVVLCKAAKHNRICTLSIGTQSAGHIFVACFDGSVMEMFNGSVGGFHTKLDIRTLCISMQYKGHHKGDWRCLTLHHSVWCWAITLVLTRRLARSGGFAA